MAQLMHWVAAGLLLGTTGSALRVAWREHSFLLAFGTTYLAVVGFSALHMTWPQRGPPRPAAFSKATGYFLRAKIAAGDAPGFDVRCPREIEDEVYAAGRWAGYVATVRSPGYIHFHLAREGDKEF